MEDYYKKLGVKRDSSLEEIKKAYLKQIKKYHPDLYKGDENFAQQKTADLNVIYNTLKDEKLRREYDEKTFKLEVKKITETTAPTEKKEKEPGIFSELFRRLKSSFNDYKTNRQENKNKIKELKENNNLTFKQRLKLNSDKLKLTFYISIMFLIILILILIVIFV